MVGKTLEQLLKRPDMTEQIAQELRNDIDEHLVQASTPMKFADNLRTFCTKHTAFKEVLIKAQNLNSEYLQSAGTEAIDTLIDADPEKWQLAGEALQEMDEANFESWAQTLPVNARSKFTGQLIIE